MQKQLFFEKTSYMEVRLQNVSLLYVQQVLTEPELHVARFQKIQNLSIRQQ